jgi:hypothetical protein
MRQKGVYGVAGDLDYSNDIDDRAWVDLLDLGDLAELVGEVRDPGRRAAELSKDKKQYVYLSYTDVCDRATHIPSPNSNPVLNHKFP